MSRRNHVPEYRLHKQSGQAIVTLTNPPGVLPPRKDVTLGAYDSPESRAEYARLLAEWLANGRRLTPAQHVPSTQPNDLTITELIEHYWEHVQLYYRDADGQPTHERDNIRLALRRLRPLYGHTPARSFGPLSLKAVRDSMIREGLCRTRINRDVDRIRRLFGWAAENELCPGSIAQDLRCVKGLKAGRSEARDRPAVPPVADAVVEATLPFCSGQVRAMIQLQRWTGMRPGEVIRMRTMDLEMTGAVWLYRPGSDHGPHGQHKTSYQGKSHVIAIGPRSQEILKPWLRLNLCEYLFQPCEAMAAFRAAQRKARKSKVQPSQQSRKNAKLKKQPRTCYTVSSYDQAISNACEKAFPPPDHLRPRADESIKAFRARLTTEENAQLKAWHKEHHWHPHQLRHTFGTQARKGHGLEAAQVLLGHSTANITQLYAERDLAKAIEVARLIG